MLFILQDQLTHLGKRIKARRLALDLTQQAAAAKAGVAHRTWRRMETEGRASIEDLVRAAIALRCDEGIVAPPMIAVALLAPTLATHPPNMGLIGKEEGDVAEVQAPGGLRRYEVVAVSYK